MAKAQVPSRGEIWLVDFDPSVGFEIQKVRPALVMSLDAVGKLPLRIVVPLTDWKSQFAGYPWFVQIVAGSTNGLVKDSGADAFQVKSVSLGRFASLLGVATTNEVDAVAAAIALCVGV